MLKNAILIQLKAFQTRAFTLRRHVVMIHTIRKRIPHEEFDYQTLMSCLEGYVRPRDRVSALLRKGMIVRVKKGLYVFGEDYRSKPYCREVLANLMYGPSYVSMDFALQHYGLIPERVESVTSVTPGRSRRFSTPIGLFTYRRIPQNAFPVGMDRVEIDESRAFLIATPEKAIADKVYEDKGTGIQTQWELHEYLETHLRIDMALLGELKPGDLLEIARSYRSRKLRVLSDLVRTVHRRIEKRASHA